MPDDTSYVPRHRNDGTFTELDQYTDAPTSVRITLEDHGDDAPWMLDGIDNFGRYTEDCRRFAELHHLLAEVPRFMADHDMPADL